MGGEEVDLSALSAVTNLIYYYYSNLITYNTQLFVDEQFCDLVRDGGAGWGGK